MMKRLQVLLEEEEYREVQETARRHQVTVAEWVRQALRKARGSGAEARDAKLRAIAATAQHQFPTADIEVMLQEIDAGRRIL